MISIGGVALNALIKNTFIEVSVADMVADSQTPSRRSTSAPPSFRHAHSASDDVKPVDQEPVSTDASTDASEEDMSPSDVDSPFCIDTDTEFDDYDSTPTARTSLVSQTDTSPRTSLVASVTPLSGKAAPWQPQSFVQDPLPYTFAREAARMVTQLKKAVEDSNLTVHVEVVNEAGSGWSISAQLKSQKDKDSVLSIAQEAVLKAAEETTCTYVLGYMAQPFVLHAKGAGFDATLAAMRDERQACWHAYSTCCRNPRACRAVHPSMMTPIKFAMTL